jgi:hypothetical protein
MPTSFHEFCEFEDAINEKLLGNRNDIMQLVHEVRQKAFFVRQAEIDRLEGMILRMRCCANCKNFQAILIGCEERMSCGLNMMKWEIK